VPGAGALLVPLDVGSLEFAVPSTGGWLVPVVGAGGVVLGVVGMPVAAGTVLVGLWAAGSVMVPLVPVAELSVAPEVDPAVPVLRPYVLAAPATEVGECASAEVDVEPAVPDVEPAGDVEPAVVDAGRPANEWPSTTAALAAPAVPSAEPPVGPVVAAVSDVPGAGATRDGAPAGLRPAFLLTRV